MAEAGFRQVEKDALPERGRVNQVSQKWRVYEDGVMANRMQDEEFEFKYGLNRSNRRTVREDIPVAKVVHSKEEEEAQKKMMEHIEKQRQIAERDAEVARKAQNEEQTRIEVERLMRAQEDALIATQFQTAEMINAERARVQMEMTDQQYAKKLYDKEKERFERKKMERHLSKQRKLLQREQAEAAGDVLAGRMESSDPPSQGFRDMSVSDADRVLRVDGRVEDAGDFSDFYIQPAEDMDPGEMRELRELQDEELARLLQDQEKKRGSAVDKDKLKEIEEKDARIAKLMYEQEKLKIKKAKSRQRQISEQPEQQCPRDQAVNRSVSLPVAYPVHQHHNIQNERLEQRLGRISVETPPDARPSPQLVSQPPSYQHSPGSHGSDDRELPPYRPPPSMSAHRQQKQQNLHQSPPNHHHLSGEVTPPYTRPPVPPHKYSEAPDYAEYANRPLPDTPPGGYADGDEPYPHRGHHEVDQVQRRSPENGSNVFTSLDPTFGGMGGGERGASGAQHSVQPTHQQQQQQPVGRGQQPRGQGQQRSHKKSPPPATPELLRYDLNYAEHLSAHPGSGASGRDPVEYADLNEMGPVQAQKRSSLNRDKKKGSCKQQ